MKKYEEALRARLENQGIFFENGQYFDKVAEIKSTFNLATPEEGQNNEDE